MKKTIVGSVIMKKIIFLLLLFIGAFAFSNEYSEKEKNTILTQFVEFQKAVKAKDINTLNKMIKYPLMGYSAEDGFYTDNNGTVTHKEIVTNKKDFLEWVKDVTLPEVNLKNNTVKDYKKGDVSITASFMNEEIKEQWGFESGDKVFIVFVSYDDPEFPGFNSYNFIFENNTLKLVKIFGGP